MKLTAERARYDIRFPPMAALAAAHAAELGAPA